MPKTTRRKSIKILPGVNVNLNKKSASLSVGGGVVASTRKKKAPKKKHGFYTGE